MGFRALLLMAGLSLTGLNAYGQPDLGHRWVMSEIPDQGVGQRYTPPPPQPPPVPGLPAQTMERPAAPTPEPAAPRRAYTLEELLHLARTNNPTIRQAQAHVSAEFGKALEAGLWPNPLANYSGELIGVSSEVQPHTPGEFQGAIFEQKFITAGKLRLSREKYQRRAQTAEHLAIAQHYKVRNDVQMQFYRALAAQQRQAVQSALVQSAEDAMLTARELYNQGQARYTDVRRADVALQRARLDLVEIDNQLRQRFRELTSVVGLELPMAPLAGTLALPAAMADFDAALQQILAGSPELAAAHAKLACDQTTVARERVQWVPDVTLSGGAGYNFENVDTVAMAGVQIDMPLFDRNQGTVRQAEADLARQHSEIRRVELHIRAKLADAYSKYRTSYLRAWEYERNILPQMRAVYEELLRSYQADRVAWPEVLEAQRDYFEAQSDYLHHVEDALVGSVLIDGYLLNKGLEAAPNPTPPGHIDSVPKPR